jgi:hypothetical protein
LPAELGGLRQVEDVQRLRDQITSLTDQLDAAFAEPVRVLDPVNFKRKRTRYRGVFRSGSGYVVPFYDESGREQQRTFETARTAHDYRLIVEAADKGQIEYAGPTFKPGDITAAGGSGGGAGGG